MNPSLSFAQELIGRGHDVLFVGIADGREIAASQGVPYQVIAEERVTLGYSHKMIEEVGKLSGKEGLMRTTALLDERNRLMLEELPEVLQTASPDLMIVDQTLSAVLSVAEYMKIPHVILCCALDFSPDVAIPPPMFPWRHQPNPLYVIRNIFGWAKFMKTLSPIRKTLDNWRAERGLGRAKLWGSEELALSQAVDAFELPRFRAIKTMRHVGPLASAERVENDEFPWDLIEGQAFVYASLGTVQNQAKHVFDIIAHVCENLDIKLVIALGGGVQLEASDFAGSPIVVHNAPQLKLLERAEAVITHAGMNTVMETLKQGKPMVAIPITNDQPGIAARIDYHKVGKVVPLANLSVENLSNALKEVIHQPIYRENALKFARIINESGGSIRAAELVEMAILRSKEGRRAL